MKLLHKLAVTLALAVAAVLGAATSSQAAGDFDFIDACYEARDNFDNTRSAIYAALDAADANIQSATATDAYRVAWVAEKRVALRTVFDEQFGTLLWNSGMTDDFIDALYGQWFDLQIATVNPEELAQFQDSHFRITAATILLERRATAETEIAEGHRRISEACEMDVLSQTLRVVLTPIMNNWNAAVDEGFVAQVISAFTGGVNIVDLVRCPIRGCSPESVVNVVIDVFGQALVDTAGGLTHLLGEILGGIEHLLGELEHLPDELLGGIEHLGRELGTGIEHLGGEIAKVFSW